MELNKGHSLLLHVFRNFPFLIKWQGSGHPHHWRWNARLPSMFTAIASLVCSTFLLFSEKPASVDELPSILWKMADNCQLGVTCGSQMNDPLLVVQGVIKRVRL
eukprot:scaffold3292_cov120-Cylindrotheca_fusiformis.AAC.3